MNFISDLLNLVDKWEKRKEKQFTYLLELINIYLNIGQLGENELKKNIGR